jgi:hypothetical protein
LVVHGNGKGDDRCTRCEYNLRLTEEVNNSRFGNRNHKTSNKEH